MSMSERGSVALSGRSQLIVYSVNEFQPIVYSSDDVDEYSLNAALKTSYASRSAASPSPPRPRRASRAASPSSRRRTARSRSRSSGRPAPRCRRRTARRSTWAASRDLGLGDRGLPRVTRGAIVKLSSSLARGITRSTFAPAAAPLGQPAAARERRRPAVRARRGRLVGRGALGVALADDRDDEQYCIGPGGTMRQSSKPPRSASAAPSIALIGCGTQPSKTPRAGPRARARLSPDASGSHTKRCSTRRSQIQQLPLAVHRRRRRAPSSPRTGSARERRAPPSGSCIAASRSPRFDRSASACRAAAAAGARAAAGRTARAARAPARARARAARRAPARAARAGCSARLLARLGAPPRG